VTALILSVASVISLTGGGVSVSSVGQGQSGGGDLAFRQAMFEAEDSRGADPAGLATLLAGLESPDLEIRRLAVRALGRFERADLSDRIVQLVDAALPAVRAEAVNALGQSVQRGGALEAHVATLIGRLEYTDGVDAESDPHVRGIVAETLGRLPYQDADRVHEVEAALASLTDAAELDVRLGAINGLESLARLQRERAPLTAETIERLQAAARAPGTGEVAGRTRRLALSALIASGGADEATVGAALDDRDPQVRRLAVLALRDADETDARAAFIGRALADESPMVRYDALGA
jgi:HEAT repeat protein